MNNFQKEITQEPPIKRKLTGWAKSKDILIIALLGFVLLFAVWRIFYTEEDADTLTHAASEEERRISGMLAQIDGVGEAEVVICQTEEGVQSVVVVCEGANDLQVVLDVREAVAAALGTTQNAVKIYLKKD